MKRPRGRTLARIVAFGFTLLAASLLFMMGNQGRRGREWAFLVGMIIYAGDGVLLLLFQDWLSAGFHVWALLGMNGGYRAAREYRQAGYSVKASARPESAEYGS